MIALLAALMLGASAHAHDCYYADRIATCGYVSVPENRAKPHGRTIDVQFVAVRGAQRSGVPVFFIAGGPGQSMIDVGRAVMQTDLGQTLRARHDLVFIDQRGTGSSHPLNCALYGAQATPAQILASLFPPRAIAACRKRLSANADLSAYTTQAAADDMNDVRAALGYKRIALWGVSYGSEFVFEYLRTHESSVQSAVVEDVAPPQFRVFPPFERGASQAIAYADRSSPGFADEVSLLEREGVPGISRASLVNGILETLTDPQNGHMLATLVHQAAMHDPKPLQTYLAERRQREVQDLAMGMHLSVTCAENIPFIAHAAFVIVQAYRRACEVWNVQPVSASFIAPVRSNVPVLMFSGAYDPWTPPYEADEALRYLPNGKHVVIPDAGHDLDRASLTAQGAAFIDAAGS